MQERLISCVNLANQAGLCFKKLIFKERNPQRITKPKESVNK